MKREYKTGARDEASRSWSPQRLADAYVQDVVKGALWLRRNKISLFFFPTRGILVRGWGGEWIGGERGWA